MLTPQQMDDFTENGYLAVDGLLDYDLDIAPVIAEYQQLLDELCEQWVAEGRLRESYSELPFERRLVEVYKAGCDYAQAIDIALPNDKIYEDTPINLGPAVFNLLKSPRMLSAVESLIGGEIYSNPIQHIRIKTPKKFVAEQDKHNSLYGKTSWHQDVGVGLEEADDTQMLTCWVAVTEATVDNGCLQVMPKSHREGMALHCTPGQLAIPEQFIELDEAIPVQLNPGGVLFFHPLCKHASLDNTSDSFRWSFDLRYNPIGQPTGRPHFPGFIAQSRLNPDSVLNDWRDWAQLWYDARARLATLDGVRAHRWEDGDPLCA